MELTNYVSVSEIIEAVEKAGCKWVASRNLSSHPDDWFLKVVLAYREHDHSWVVWLYNGEYKGLSEGYYTEIREEAKNKYNAKR